MLTYLIIFIANFVVAYFYIDYGDYVKAFWLSVYLVTMVFVVDLIKHYIKKETINRVRLNMVLSFLADCKLTTVLDGVRYEVHCIVGLNSLDLRIS